MVLVSHRVPFKIDADIVIRVRKRWPHTDFFKETLVISKNLIMRLNRTKDKDGKMAYNIYTFKACGALEGTFEYYMLDQAMEKFEELLYGDK